MLWRRTKYLIWSLFLISSAYAQFATFGHLTTDQGLSYNSISCMAQDPKGFIWIGTYTGLNKYDGYKLTTNFGDDSTAKYFSTARVRFIYPDKENNLWVSVEDEGLAKLNLATNKLTRYVYDSASKNCIISNFINEIAEFEDGVIYMATNMGVCMLDKKTGKVTSFTHSDKDENSLLTNNVKTFTKDIEGNLWFGHSGYGITKYEPAKKKFTRHSMSDPKFKLLGNRIRDLYADSKGILWISMWHAGNAFYDIKKDYFWNHDDTTKYYESLKSLGLISEFIEDKNGDIWMCSAEKGVVRLDRETRTYTTFENNPNDPHTISDNTNLCIMQDRSGLIWSGTWKGGVNYFNPSTLKFGHVKHESNKENTLNANDVLAFYQNGKNEVIVGTSKSLCIFDPENRQFKKVTNESRRDNEGLVENSQVNFIFKDIDGSFWYCTNGGGAYRYFPDKKKYVVYGLSNGEQHYLPDVPDYMVLGHDSSIWTATWGGGLWRYDRKADKFFPHMNDPKGEFFSPVIYNLTVDPDQNIWIGTQEKGLVLLDPQTKKFSHVGDKGAIYNKGSVGSVMVDAKDKNKLWITTNGHLLEFDRKTYNFIDHTEISKGLSADFWGCVQDNDGHLWITSTHDLYRFNPAAKHFTVYTKANGTQEKEFNSNAIIKLSNGKLMLGGVNGFNYFDPKDIHDQNSPPSVVFTDLFVLNKPGFISENISYVNELTLDYKDYFFAIHFAAIDFSDPGKNEFMYKMDGLDRDWIEIGEQHQLTFTNLDPGDYVLNIKAANSQGMWNETPLQLKITITPPFWRTNWFYALCVIIIVGSIYLYIRWREKKLRVEKEVLEKKVEERTHELNEEKLKVEEAHKDIKDSIYYAQKIQSSIIPSEEDFKKILPNSFVLFQPKDIVSGDFYWILEKDNFVFCAIADCTGHGVPGGFMTMLGSGLLNEIVNEQKLSEPSDILNKLREKIISTLKQTGKAGENKDGMDIVLLRFNRNNRELAYACANNGFLIIENGSMTEHYGDKQPVGIYGHEIKPFTAHKLVLKENVTIYSYTDGYPDQFGGEKGKKFKYKTLNNLLIENSHLQLMYQKDKLHEAFENWKGDHEQIDDVCVVGIKF